MDHAGACINGDYNLIILPNHEDYLENCAMLRTRRKPLLCYVYAFLNLGEVCCFALLFFALFSI